MQNLSNWYCHRENTPTPTPTHKHNTHTRQNNAHITQWHQAVYHWYMQNSFQMWHGWSYPPTENDDIHFFKKKMIAKYKTECFKTIIPPHPPFQKRSVIFCCLILPISSLFAILHCCCDVVLCTYIIFLKLKEKTTAMLVKLSKAQSN